jgi:hypothetical protein
VCVCMGEWLQSAEVMVVVAVVEVLVVGGGGGCSGCW